jgi:hypothetical protein
MVTLLAGLLVPLVGARPAPIQAQEDGDIPLSVAAFGAHPRLLITQVYVNQTLKPRAQAGVETWAALAAYVSGAGRERLDSGRRCDRWRWRGW